MYKIDWVRKLTSRKFWVAIIALVTDLILAFGGTAETAEKVAGIIMAGATVIAYIIAEGLVDKAGAEGITIPIYEEDEPPEDDPEE